MVPPVHRRPRPTPLTDIDAVDVPLDGDRFALVVVVPQARGVARQTADFLFWRRDAQGLRKMSVQEIEDVQARTMRPVLELRLPLSPGRIQQDGAEVRLDVGVLNVSQATASFAVVTLALGRRASARPMTNPEWHPEQMTDAWKVWRTVIASGSSARWSPITPGFTLTLQPLVLVVNVLEQDYLGPSRGIGLLRLDSDGGVKIYRLSFNSHVPRAVNAPP